MAARDPLRVGSLYTGYGGLDMAAAQVWDTELAWVADNDPAASAVLAHHHPQVPNLGDITAVEWSAVPPVDIVTAGFPCTDISYAGLGAGIVRGNRSGLWHSTADALGVLRPRIVVLENVAAIVVRRPGLDVVLTDLARLGFDAVWTCVRASDVGAPHPRNRWFLVAHSADVGHERGRGAWGRRPGPADGGVAAADSDRGALGEELDGEPQSAEADHEDDQPDASGRVLDRAWGPYAAAVHRWEHILGRPAPEPTDLGLNGQPRLTPAFVEWMMGLPAGHVTGVPGLSRNQQLTRLGNGVVPQQGAYALRMPLPALEVAA